MEHRKHTLPQGPSRIRKIGAYVFVSIKLVGTAGWSFPHQRHLYQSGAFCQHTTALTPAFLRLTCFFTLILNTINRNNGQH